MTGSGESPPDDFSAGQHLHVLVAGVSDYAIYMLNPEGYVNTWNAGAQRFKGYAAQEIVGKHFSVFYTPEDRAAGVPEKVLQTVLNEGKFEAEGWRVRKDGTRFWAHVIIDPIRDDNGELIGFAKITRDITAKKQAAEASEKAAAALFQSQKMEAIGQLTGGIAHDFNNLLSILSTSLDILATRLHSAEDIELLESMHRAIEQGATLTQQLLAFTRQQPLNVGKYNLNTVIGGFASILRSACDSSIAFEVELEPTLWTVMVDAARFEAALLNLAVNARDAMPDGGRLAITTENIELDAQQVGNLEKGKYIKVSVTDTGSGMSPDVMARAFEPFFTTKQLGKGTGLGLSQVYGFILQSGGEIVLHSQVGSGTSVHIYLPAIADGVEPDADSGPYH